MYVGSFLSYLFVAFHGLTPSSHLTDKDHAKRNYLCSRGLLLIGRADSIVWRGWHGC